MARQKMICAAPLRNGRVCQNSGYFPCPDHPIGPPTAEALNHQNFESQYATWAKEAGWDPRPPLNLRGFRRYWKHNLAFVLTAAELGAEYRRWRKVIHEETDPLTPFDLKLFCEWWRSR